MTDVRCVNCGGFINAAGEDYKGDPFWRHTNGDHTQCKLFATPPREYPKPEERT